jgi:hypothetical protein
MKRKLTALLVTCIALAGVAALSAAGSGCELVVQLDRSLADAGAPDAFQYGVCPICQDEAGAEGGGDGGEDATGQADSGAGIDATTGGSDANSAGDGEAGANHGADTGPG